MDLIATTLFGLEEVLVKELEALGAADIQAFNRAVRYRGDMALLYRSNLELRTALKILKPIANFQVRNEEELYKRVLRMPWSQYLNIRRTFAIDGIANSEHFRHSKYVALKTKDAIADHFRKKTGKRPNVDTDEPDLRIQVHISDTTCTLSLDSSGTSLDRRGYRLARTEAPINEVLAAGILQLSDWDKAQPLLDPMCGSGTFPIEAALMAQHIPPGRRRHFAFEQWKDFDRLLWKKVKEEAEARIRPGIPIIKGSDTDTRGLDAARQNARRAGVNRAIDFSQMDFLQSESLTGAGTLVFNPPYGERLAAEAVNDLYEQIGNRLKHHFPGWTAWIISGNSEAVKHIGLRPSRKIKLFNGPLECRLLKYELFEGKKKDR